VAVLVPDSAVLLLQAINKDVIEKITRTVSSCLINNFLSGENCDDRKVQYSE